ncbi:hypothetical protein H4R99_000809 [Coemansia sp. RSA 1722]|nr:hypothetical protein IWW45_001767 [Coemansia sp. RSA 485]KAJ2605805.1 hypothetical protein H4R99_000809 [Coemansia sp. RSA 1722]KAJ2638305.1 hypothetical protein GGF40_001756 [Coemansia sp. RSA 1286]
MVFGHTQLYAVNQSGKTLTKSKYMIKSNMGNAPVTVPKINTDSLKCRSSSMSTSGVDILTVRGGTNVTFQYKHEDTKSVTNIPVMSASHFGPCTVFMALASTKGESDSWFKIFEEGWNKSDKEWCTRKVIKNDGKLEFQIPNDIAPGLYYVRSELIALHQATTNGAQIYNNCALIQVDSTGDLKPKGYKIPGIYTGKEEALTWARSRDSAEYPALSPKPYYLDGNAGSSAGSLA